MTVHLLLLVFLCSCVSIASGQSVVIGGNTANPDDNVALTCTLTDHDTTGLTLEYEWSLSGEVLQRSSSNEYAIPGVRVTDARDGYTCSVFIEGESDALVTGTNSLNITIPDFSMRFLRDPSATARFDYAGLNITYVCQTSFLFTLTDLTADVEIFYPNEEAPIEGSDNHVGVTDTVMDGSNFERTLYFYPISADDEGEYRCTGTIRPEVTNPYVTNGRGEFRREHSVFETTLSVQVSGSNRLLDIPPYNILNVTCTADATTTRGPVPVYMTFSWLRLFPRTSLPASSFTNGRGFGSTVSSTLTLLFNESGSHTYLCETRLDVPDVLGMDMIAVDAIDVAAPPSALEDVAVLTLAQDSAAIQWRVSALQYGPETYRVFYDSTCTLSLVSESVSSGEDISQTNFVLLVELEGLQVNTTYYYQVKASNVAGTVLSLIGSFTTSSNNATCVNINGLLACTCNSGFTEDGLNCLNINECDVTDPCDHNAICVDSDGSFTCTCIPGFTGDGFNCQECDVADLCDNNSICVDVDGSFTCTCIPGFTGDGINCQNINECDVDCPCDHNAVCNDTEGSFVCVCNDGFLGDGINCQCDSDDADGACVFTTVGIGVSAAVALLFGTGGFILGMITGTCRPRLKIRTQAANQEVERESPPLEPVPQYEEIVLDETRGISLTGNSAYGCKM